MLFHCEGYSLSPFPGAFLLARGTGGAWNHLNSDRDASGMRLNPSGDTFGRHIRRSTALM
jgi:hypothetical protein